MFQGLRRNSLLYVLDKGENPNLRIGQVISTSNPQTKYPTFNNGFTPQPMETVVDVKVKLGDEEVDFKQLPANGQIANDKNLVVSDNKDAMRKKRKITHMNHPPSPPKPLFPFMARRTFGSTPCFWSRGARRPSIPLLDVEPSFPNTYVLLSILS